MNTIADKIDQYHDTELREYLDSRSEPEYEDCPNKYCANGYDTWNKEICSTCDGTGRIIKQVCKDCGSPNGRCVCDGEY